MSNANVEFANKNKLTEYFMELTKPENTDDLKKIGIGLVAILFASIVFYIASADPKALTEQFYYYCFFGILPVIIGISFASNVFNGLMDITQLYFYGGIVFIFIISAYMFQKVMNPERMSRITYLMGFLSVFVLIVGLAIIYRIFVRTVINVRGWLGFFLKCLFLLPCLLIDLLETVFVELKTAPKMIIALFVLEILVLLAYIYIQKFSMQTSDSIILLDKPVFLTRLQPIGNANQLFMNTNEMDNPSKSAKSIRENYSISMWFYVNQHPNTHAAYSKETNIFRYGYPNSSVGHPRVAYYNNTKDANKSDKFIVYVNDAVTADSKNESANVGMEGTSSQQKDKKGGRVENNSSGIFIDIPTQSWNQLVISYNKSVVDIFVNGNLEKSVPLLGNLRPEYSEGDVIEVGHGDNTVTGGGLHGAICNVVYHKTPLSAFQIAGYYNLHRYKNPPTNK
jgi:hypothetical protein